MSEIDEREIKRRFEVISQFELSPEVTARDLEQVRKRLIEQTSGQQTREQKIWRIIMKSPITKLAAAAVIIIAIMIVTDWFGSSIDIAKPAYGITDLPELIKNAKTMHMKGWFYSSQAKQESGEPVKSEFDYWFDIENGRYRLHKPGGIDKDTGKPKYFITVSDGQYVMSSAFNRSRSTGRTWKSISFTKLSPFKARLEAHKASGFLMQMFGNVDQIEGSTKVGQEEINGVMYDIWKSEIYLVNGFGNRFRTWLASESGDIGRVLFWQTRKDEEDLRLVFDLHTIELGIVPPEGIFDTTPPDGYILNNTKETAQTDTLGIDLQKACPKNYELHAHIGFTLKDGSVILGWSCPDKKRSSQIDLFRNLTFGGKLPELAGKIETLTSIPSKPSIKYMGRHLAYTQKDKIFYEWSLYVPDKKPPARNSLLGYNLNIKYQVDENALGDRPGSLGEDLVIDTNQDFNTWVRGAMAELSDDGKAPPHITYENVLQLAEKIRKSLNK
jgi:hypothetical protein